MNPCTIHRVLINFTLKFLQFTQIISIIRIKPMTPMCKMPIKLNIQVKRNNIKIATKWITFRCIFTLNIVTAKLRTKHIEHVICTS